MREFGDYVDCGGRRVVLYLREKEDLKLELWKMFPEQGVDRNFGLGLGFVGIDLS